MVSVGVVGASGYTGAELMRLCALHPEFEVSVATARSYEGDEVSSVYPSLAPLYPRTRYQSTNTTDLEGLDVLFLALPHGESHRVAAGIRSSVGVIVDLSADFRLKDPESYVQWYGWEHSAPDLLDEAVYGLPELFRPEIQRARLIASPGCYPTAVGLALVPFVRSGIVAGDVVIDAASGISGAGRLLQEGTQFCAVDGGMSAYGTGVHRHTPEMEQLIGAKVLFSPHLVPMTRGILATCYVRSAIELTTQEALELLAAQFEDEPFVTVSERLPSTKVALGSNCAHLSAHSDPRTGWLVVFCALDNLLKGASGQAVQCANLALGIDECTGLSAAGLYP